MSEMSKSNCKVICPLCKEPLSKTEKFEDHVLKCAKERHVCEVCSKTFKKMEYLIRHKRQKHTAENTTPKDDHIEKGLSVDVESLKGKQSKSIEKKADNPKSEPDTEESDWDHDPEVEIVDNSEEMDDTRNVNDIRTGRIYRKRTSPMPVVAPIKDKKLTQYVKPKASVEKIEDEGSYEAEGSLGRTEQNVIQSKKKHALKIETSIESRDNKVVRNLIVNQDNDELLASSSIIKEGFTFNGTDIRISDFIDTGVNIKPENIMVQATGRKTEIVIHYEES